MYRLCVEKGEIKALIPQKNVQKKKNICIIKKKKKGQKVEKTGRKYASDMRGVCAKKITYRG
jgi:hypothetical protein